MNREALIELKAKVEAGEAPEYSVFKEAYVKTVWQALPFDTRGRAWSAYNGSLDSAKALHDAVLHERIAVTFTYSARYGAKAILLDGMTEETWGGDAWHETASRAWLLAILSALIAMESET